MVLTDLVDLEVRGDFQPTFGDAAVGVEGPPLRCTVSVEVVLPNPNAPVLADQHRLEGGASQYSIRCRPRHVAPSITSSFASVRSGRATQTWQIWHLW